MNIEKCLFSTIKCCTPMSSNLYTFSNRFWTFHSFLDVVFFVMILFCISCARLASPLGCNIALQPKSLKIVLSYQTDYLEWDRNNNIR